MLEKQKLEEVDVAFLKLGTLLSGILYDEHGRMLWPARMAITEAFLFKLKEKDINKVYYSPPKYKSYINKEQIFSEVTQNYARQAIEDISHQISYGKLPDTKVARATIDRIFNDMQERPNGFLNLMVLKDYDTYTYYHSINVGILSMFLTKKLGFNDLFVHEAGMGGLLHDIGKIKIPFRIVNKKDPLTEEEYKIMKNHPVLGFNLIKDDTMLSNYVKKMVLFHHERWNGSGYPLKLKDDSIGNFAGIVAVCDVYDALTTERPYKKSFSINDALLYLMRNTQVLFNPYVAQRMINELSMMYDLGSFFPVGSFVRLSTGETGYISGKENEYSVRPEVVIVKNFHGVPLRNPIQADLKRDTTRVIVKTIDNPEDIEKLQELL
jgi:putative nucleotidyltransferase with HDIG domain